VWRHKDERTVISLEIAIIAHPSVMPSRKHSSCLYFQLRKIKRKILFLYHKQTNVFRLVSEHDLFERMACESPHCDNVLKHLYSQYKCFKTSSQFGLLNLLKILKNYTQVALVICCIFYLQFFAIQSLPFSRTFSLYTVIYLLLIQIYYMPTC